MKFSFFELVMALALLALIAFFVVPRIVNGSPEVRASQAVALELKLDKLFAQWKSVGGLNGDGEGDYTALTRNLLLCLTSPLHAPYASAPVSSNNFGPSGVYEKPSLFPSPSDIRLTGFSSAGLKNTTLEMSDGRPHPAILLEGTFAVLYDGREWTVKPALN